MDCSASNVDVYVDGYREAASHVQLGSTEDLYSQQVFTQYPILVSAPQSDLSVVTRGQTVVVGVATVLS